MSSDINSIEINIISYEELIPIIDKDTREHLKEVPFGNFQLELDLVHEVYQHSVDIGYCRCYKVSVNDNYAGYMVVMASEMLHHRDTMQAITDVFYIVPAYRGSGTFKVLLDYVEADMRANSIKFLTVGINPNMPHVDKIKEFVQSSGYVCTEFSLTKELL